MRRGASLEPSGSFQGALKPLRRIAILAIAVLMAACQANEIRPTPHPHGSRRPYGRAVDIVTTLACGTVRGTILGSARGHR